MLPLSMIPAVALPAVCITIVAAGEEWRRKKNINIEEKFQESESRLVHRHDIVPWHFFVICIYDTQ